MRLPGSIHDSPNYFLADLPPGATLTAPLITEACQTLRRNREKYLQRRSTASLVRTLNEVGQSWLEPDNPYRRYALEHGPAELGFSKATLARGLDSFFSHLNTEEMEALLVLELGHGKRLDSWSATKEERTANLTSLAIGPELITHITAGNIPNPTLMSMVLGLLTRSAQFVKCASGATLLPRLFAHSLYELDSKLGACLELAEWPGGEPQLEAALFAESDCVTATGADETLESIRSRLPGRTRFLPYGHQVSFGYVTREALDAGDPQSIAARAARDVSAWDQLGCLSPHVFYVEEDGKGSGERFATLLAGEMERLERIEPRGQLTPEASAAIASLRAVYDIRASHVPDTKHWRSEGSTAWTVVFETDPLFQVSCLNRFIYVKEIGGLTDAINGVDRLHGQVSTVGLAAVPHEQTAIVDRLARWGVSRVCPLGQMQNPPLTWRHDGRPPLGDLVRWVNWEHEDD